jgi:hypothetical protein
MHVTALQDLAKDPQQRRGLGCIVTAAGKRLNAFKLTRDMLFRRHDVPIRLREVVGEEGHS